MPKDTLRQASMLLDLEGFLLDEPLADNNRPTERQRQERQQLLESYGVSDMRFFQAKAPRLQTSEQRFEVAVATHKTIDLVFRTQVFKLSREMCTPSRISTAPGVLRQNTLAEAIHETPAHSTATLSRRPAPKGASSASAQDHSRTPGARTCK